MIALWKKQHTDIQWRVPSFGKQRRQLLDFFGDNEVIGGKSDIDYGDYPILSGRRATPTFWSFVSFYSKTKCSFLANI